MDTTTHLQAPPAEPFVCALSASEVSDLLGVSLRTTRRLISSGVLPSFVVGDARCRRVSALDLVALVRSGRGAATTQSPAGTG